MMLMMIAMKVSRQSDFCFSFNVSLSAILNFSTEGRSGYQGTGITVKNKSKHVEDGTYLESS